VKNLINLNPKIKKIKDKLSYQIKVSVNKILKFPKRKLDNS
jgi:hypothetical protein